MSWSWSFLGGARRKKESRSVKPATYTYVVAHKAAQIVRHLWHSPAPSFADMTDLPKPLRDRLAADFVLPRLEIDEKPPTG